MRKRSRAREISLQMLYQMEASGLTAGECIKNFWQCFETQKTPEKIDDEIRGFAEELFNKVMEHKKEIDELVQKSADHWQLNRMACVDRNILRLGTCEIVFCKDIPVKVALNESIELAKTFGDQESSKFVNGVLDKIAKAHHDS